MSLHVLKFGGTSVAGIDRIRHVASIVAARKQQGHQVVVVVSAMAGVTNQLVEWVNAFGTLPDAAEYDAVVATGEMVTAGLLAIALQQAGHTARSWQGWQIPLYTSDAHSKARIKDIPATGVLAQLAAGGIPVIAGFQGVTKTGRLTTVGRGGSDTAAVAVAAALKADRCDIFTDVNGVYTADPRIVPKAKKLPKVSFEEMLEMASLGAKVLQTRSVELAMKENVRLQVLSSFEDTAGTMVVNEDEMADLEQQVVSGVTYNRDETKISLWDVADRPGVSATIFGAMAGAGINVDMIIQNVSEDGTKTGITFTVPRPELSAAIKVLETEQQSVGYRGWTVEQDIAKISVVGLGMRSHAGVAATMFRTLADKGINIMAISTSEIKISVLINAAYTELAVRSLHTAYGLDAA